MILGENEEPIGILAGVYKHYKGPLYQVIGYSHNASDDNNVQVLYIGLELDSAKVGPRFATRNWHEFFETVCTVHDGMPAYCEEHEEIVRVERLDKRENCDYLKHWVERFTYMGPVYYKGFES